MVTAKVPVRPLLLVIASEYAPLKPIGSWAVTVWFVNDRTERRVFANATIGVTPAGLKDWPEIVILFVVVLTTALKTVGLGAAATRPATARSTTTRRSGERFIYWPPG
jgi:hypothetical protein